MEQSYLKFYSLHEIDVADNLFKDLLKKKENIGDAEKYVANIFDIAEDSNYREYNITSHTTEVIGLIEEIIANQDNSVFLRNTSLIANRLYRAEVDAQEQVEKMKVKIHKGNIIQSLMKKGEILIYSISKVDNNKFLSLEDFINKQGLPYKKAVYKNCKITITDSKIESIYISDSNKKDSGYWWKQFLELQPIKSDEDNTRDSFNSIDIILKSINNKEIYFPLRNIILGYYQTSSYFKLNDIIDLIHSFSEDKDLKKEKIIDKIKKKFERKKIDTVFTISKDEIKTRMKKIVKINDKFDISVKGIFSKNDIETKKSHNEYSLIIYDINEESYNLFSKNNNQDKNED